MMTTIAIIGYGYWGPNLLRNYMELPRATVKWVCDQRRDALDRACLRYPSVSATTELQEVLDDDAVDAVVIATPITTHHPLARAALLAGKHVFVEKPMTATAEEAMDLVELAAGRGLTLMVGHTFVFSPPVRKVKELIDAGELGDIHFVTSSRVNLGLHQKDASVVWDLAPHDLSILHYWLGETASSVIATGRGCVTCDNPDVAFVNLTLPFGDRGLGRGLVAVAGEAAPDRRGGHPQDAALRRHGERREGQALRPRRQLQGPGDVRRVPAVVPDRGHPLARSSRAPNRCSPRPRTSWTASSPGRRPSRTVWRA